MRAILAASIVAVTAACVGSIGDDGDDGPRDEPSKTGTSEDRSIGPAPIRRLNRLEYNNTVRDLFKGSLSPAESWPADGIESGFDNDVNGQGATADLIEQAMRSAEVVAADAITRLATLLPCSATSTDATVCGKQFIEQYGRRAYRRPLTDNDRARLSAILAYGVEHGGLKDGVRLVITAMLQAPAFLYRPETHATLTDHELATRLSYLLTNSTPDDALLDAADAGKLHQPAELRAHAERLLASPAGRRALDHFFSQWFPFERLSKTVKSTTLYPDFDESIRSGMAAGARAFIQHVVFESPEGDISELLSANYTFANSRTAPLYGLSVTGEALQKITFKEPRSGLLTEAGIMAALSDNYQSSPVARGKFVFKDILCQDIPSPPANLPAAGVPPPPDPTKTTRERFDEHRNNPACAGCHQVMDPLGFALENYDAIGRYRATENGKTIDARGDVNLEGQAVSFNGPLELSRYIAGSSLLRDCFARKWFTYTFGRASAAEDAATLVAMSKQLDGGKTKIRDFLIGVTQTWAFTHRPEANISGCTP